MPRLYSVFDSNVYRRLGNEAFAELRSLERLHSVIGMASYWVAAELLSHLVDEDGDLASAVNSLGRLQQHCSQFDGSKHEIRFIADGDAHLCRMLFGRVQVGDLAARAGELIGIIATDVTAVRTYGNTLEEIRDHVASEEERFVEGMWNRFVLSVLPDATGWEAIRKNRILREQITTALDGIDGERLLARAFVRRAARLLDLDLDESVLDSKVDTVITVFPLPLRFYDQIVRRIVQDGLDFVEAV